MKIVLVFLILGVIFLVYKKIKSKNIFISSQFLNLSKVTIFKFEDNLKFFLVIKK